MHVLRRLTGAVFATGCIASPPRSVAESKSSNTCLSKNKLQILFLDWRFEFTKWFDEIQGSSISSLFMPDLRQFPSATLCEMLWENGSRVCGVEAILRRDDGCVYAMHDSGPAGSEKHVGHSWGFGVAPSVFAKTSGPTDPTCPAVQQLILLLCLSIEWRQMCHSQVCCVAWQFMPEDVTESLYTYRPYQEDVSLSQKHKNILGCFPIGRGAELHTVKCTLGWELEGVERNFNRLTTFHTFEFQGSLCMLESGVWREIQPARDSVLRRSRAWVCDLAIRWDKQLMSCHSFIN